MLLRPLRNITSQSKEGDERRALNPGLPRNYLGCLSEVEASKISGAFLPDELLSLRGSLTYSYEDLQYHLDECGLCCWWVRFSEREMDHWCHSQSWDGEPRRRHLCMWKDDFVGVFARDHDLGLASSSESSSESALWEKGFLGQPSPNLLCMHSPLPLGAQSFAPHLIGLCRELGIFQSRASPSSWTQRAYPLRHCVQPSTFLVDHGVI